MQEIRYNKAIEDSRLAVARSTSFKSWCQEALLVSPLVALQYVQVYPKGMITLGFFFESLSEKTGQTPPSFNSAHFPQAVTLNI